MLVSFRPRSQHRWERGFLLRATTMNSNDITKGQAAGGAANLVLYA